MNTTGLTYRTLIFTIAILTALGSAAQGRRVEIRRVDADMPPKAPEKIDFATTEEELAEALTEPETSLEVIVAPPHEGWYYSDPATIRVGDYDVLLETTRMRRARHGKYEGRIGSIEIGFNNFREMPDAYNGYEEPERGFMDLRIGKSISFTWNWYTFSTALTRDRSVGLTGGIGLVSNNYRFKAANPFEVIDKQIRPIESGRNVRKSKMTTFAIHFPAALEFNMRRDFFFSVGGWLDLVTGSHIKWKSPKRKLRRLSPNFFQAGVTARVGFRHAYLFGSYNFVEMFEQGYGPRLNPYTIGVGFGF